MEEQSGNMCEHCGAEMKDGVCPSCGSAEGHEHGADDTGDAGNA